MHFAPFYFVCYTLYGGYMIYVIMCAGQGKRWNNYKGVPKHLIKINGETLIGRTTRMLKEYGIDNYYITSSDIRYIQYGKVIEQTKNDCEIDRFEESIIKGDICYLYGDVYYTEEALKTIINTLVDDVMFFGSEDEIFGVKVKDVNMFLRHKQRVKDLYLSGKIDRSIGWEIYRSINNIDFREHMITNRYIKILDETDDIDFPSDYEKFVARRNK